jgi:hypothetical protein
LKFEKNCYVRNLRLFLISIFDGGHDAFFLVSSDEIETRSRNCDQNQNIDVHHVHVIVELQKMDEKMRKKISNFMDERNILINFDSRRSFLSFND